MKPIHTITLASSLALGVTLATARASAQSRVDTVEYTGPDRGLLRSGVWTLGLSYAPAMIVGIESPLREDRYLFVPVAGPWIDFGRRNCRDCQHEGLNQVLLGADGIVQGVGALEIVGSLLFTEHSVRSRTVRRSTEDTALSLRLAPSCVTTGCRVTAIGNF